ncbi:MAG: hypothetical protein ACXWDO_06360 [Bacteroidia bacterium]
MSIKTDDLCQALVQTLQKEHQFLRKISDQGIFSLPKSTLQYICGKAVFTAGEGIFGAQPIWVIKSAENKNSLKPLFFSYKDHLQEKHFLYIDVISVSQDDDLLVQIQPMLQNVHPHKKLVAIILKCTFKQVEVWVEKWTDKIGSILRPYKNPMEISTADDDEQIWMVCWQDAIPKETADIHANADIAMEDAIKDMYYESMLLVLKRIISLRTNLDENGLNAQTRLATIFKMVFAKEQGVSLEEVYDPEAMAGLTDSQLATHNFINDMEKAFNVDFSDDEIENIVSIKDLVGIIIHKKSQ